MRNCRVVLYPRCAEYFRSNRTTAAVRYYSENARLILVITLLPAAVAGFSQSIVNILYDSRYAGAGTILMAGGLGTVVYALQNASENLLVASGSTRVVLIANLLRLFIIVPATLLGFYLFGFPGFLWFSLAAGVPVLGYYFLEQHRQRLLDARSELARVALPLAVFAVCLGASGLLQSFVLPHWQHHSFK